MVAENLGTKATLHAGTNPVRVEKMESGEYTLVYKGSDGVEASIVVDAVMMATGRTPRTDGLGLEVSALDAYSGHGRCLPCSPPSPAHTAPAFRCCTEFRCWVALL